MPRVVPGLHWFIILTNKNSSMQTVRPFLFFLWCFFFSGTCFSQDSLADTAVKYNTGSRLPKTEQEYHTGNGKTYIYPKPGLFDFITKLPGDAAGMVSTAFKKPGIEPLLLVAGSTTVLLFSDQAIADRAKKATQHFLILSTM